MTIQKSTAVCGINADYNCGIIVIECRTDLRRDSSGLNVGVLRDVSSWHCCVGRNKLQEKRIVALLKTQVLILLIN